MPPPIPPPHYLPTFATPPPAALRRTPFHRTLTPRRRPHHCPSPLARASLNQPVKRPTPRTFEYVTWAQVEAMCQDLSTAAASERFDVVLAITRGGLIPATLLCEALELRNLLSTTVLFYTDMGDQFFGMTEPRFLSFPSPDALEGRRVLVVDDVWDSGRTAHAVKVRVERAKASFVKVATLHFKPATNSLKGSMPDFYSKTTENWVIYPWETSSPNVPSPDQAHNVADQESASLT